MYQTGELIKFSPFVFKNGNQPKPKYCIVLGQIDDKVMMVSLPTSKDHVPSDVTLEHGCVDIPERGVNAFVFNPSDQVTSSFSFPRPTFVYGEQVDEYEQKYLEHLRGLAKPEVSNYVVVVKETIDYIIKKVNNDSNCRNIE